MLADPHEDEEYKKAITKLQKFLKRRKVERTWAKAIEELREKFLDPRALEAGAADSKWYSNTALAARAPAAVSIPHIDPACPALCALSHNTVPSTVVP